MKTSFLIVILAVYTTAFSQPLFDTKYIEIEKVELVVNYAMKYAPDSLRPTKTRQENMLLFLGKTMSKFFSFNTHIFDIESKKITTEAQLQAWVSSPKGLPTSRFIYRIYKNYPKGQLTFTDHIPSTTFKFTESLNLFQWRIFADTATITGYKTQKATTEFGGRSWVAWFAQEVPYRDGPYKFNGLPGLIVKIYDSREHYVFELISIEKPEKEAMIEIEDRNYLVTSKKEYYKAEKAFRDEIINRAKEAGFDNELRQNIARNYTELNNFIELDRK